MGDGNPRAMWVEGQTGAATVEFNVTVAQSIRNTSTTQSSYITPEHIAKELYLLLQRRMLIYVHSCSIHNS